jgi:hypothetical protein
MKSGSMPAKKSVSGIDTPGSGQTKIKKYHLNVLVYSKNRPFQLQQMLKSFSENAFLD